jgi:hypothetical protein
MTHPARSTLAAGRHRYARAVRATPDIAQNCPPAMQPREALGGGAVATEVAATLPQARGKGQPLEAALQQSMGQALGADFRGVRVHTDAEADRKLAIKRRGSMQPMKMLMCRSRLWRHMGGVLRTRQSTPTSQMRSFAT